MTRRLVATLLLLCALAGAAVALPPWQQYGGDAARTGNSHEDGFIPGVIAWQLSFTGNISDSPAVDSQGTAYIGVSGGYMAAVYLQTGTQKWLHRYTTDSQSSPALSNDEQWLYVGGTAGLHQLSTANGYTQWVHSTGGAVVGSPVVDAETGLIYAVSANNVLYVRSLAPACCDCAGHHAVPPVTACLHATAARLGSCVWLM
jgi:outer membrane protein assembly factor BamB